MWRSLFHACVGRPPRAAGDRRGQQENGREEEEREDDSISIVQGEIAHLHGKIVELSTQLDLERAEYARDSQQTQSELAIRSRQMAEQMRTCLGRIDELERVNSNLREDISIATRRERGLAGQLAMVREELERREVEKTALITSLETALATIYKLKASQ